MDVIERGHPPAWWRPGPAATPPGPTRPPASSPPTRRARRSWSPTRPSPWPAWPRAPACWRPTWRPCWPSSPPTPPSSPEPLADILRAAVADSFNSMTVDGCTSTNDTVVLMASGRAGSGDPNVLADAVTEVCADLAGQMAADAEGAVADLPGPGDRGPLRRRGPPGRPQGGRLAAGQVLGQRRRPLLGPGGERAGLGRGRLRHGPADHRLRRDDGVPGRRRGPLRPRRGGRPHGRLAGRRSSAGWASPTAPAWSWASSSATATSTRTGRRRERRARLADPSARRDKAAVLVESLPYIRRFLDKVVVVKYGGQRAPGQAGRGRRSTRTRPWRPSPRTSS